MYNKNTYYEKYINLFLFYIIGFIIIGFLSSYYNYIISNLKYFISYIELQKDFKRNENYFIYCNNNSILKILKKHEKINKPKVSIICPIYNRERYIIRLMRSIQYQNFKDIEILFIDDYSTDNSVQILEEYKQYDKRIIIIKNKKNKGTYMNRNIGVLWSKGKYIIIPDPDDILSKTILKLCYKYAEKYNYEMIRFSIYAGNDEITFEEFVKKFGNKQVIQSEIPTNIFYGSNELHVIDLYITNKFIKKEVYIKSLNLLNNYYLNLYMTYKEDSMINYLLYRTAKSFYIFKKIGYYYIKHTQSITNNILKISELRVKFSFIFLKLIIEYSKNIKYEKDMANLLLTDLNRNFKSIKQLSSYNINFNFYNDIINIYLNCKFITKDNKMLLLDLKEIFKQIKNKKYHKTNNHF